MRQTRLFINRAGDTIVEVMLAAVILSMMLIGAYTLTARATRLNQSAYERTRASELVQEQAELLKYAKNIGDPVWTTASNMPTPTIVFYDCRTSSGIPPILPTNAFYISYSIPTPGVVNLDMEAGSISPKRDDLYSTWVNKKQTTANYHEFYVYSCWQGMGNMGNQLSATVVRVRVQ